MIGKWYHWLWHDFLKLQQPITYSVVQSMTDNQLVWMIAGCIIGSLFWILIVHFIAVEGTYINHI